MELVDETRSLDDVQPFEKFLKIIEKPPNKNEKIENAHISFLIGKGKIIEGNTIYRLVRS